MSNVRAVAASMLLGILAGPAALEAQGINEGRWPTQPISRVERVIAPFLEGWYVNDDESITYSFGYLNLNGSVIEIEHGEKNSIEPAELGGMQPTVFLPGRHYGVFTVTVPPEMRDGDVWWRIVNPNGRTTEVPGRTSWSAYRLDWRPRPHGTVPPEVTFEGGQQPIGPGLGPAGVMAERVVTTTVGAATTLSVHVREISVRSPDETDPVLLAGPTPVRVVWTRYQGAVGSTVEFSRHEATPVPDSTANRGYSCYSAVPCYELDEGQVIHVPAGEGTVQVVATFSEPGEYLLHAQVDNWPLPDSGATDQCCWTNGYVRVRVGAG